MIDGLEDKNYYELLGVSPDASPEEIKIAYREIARVFHPDSNFFSEILESSGYDSTHVISPEDSDLFKLITDAYNTLMDEQERLLYDAQLTSRIRGLKDKKVDIVDLWMKWDEETTEKGTNKRPRKESATWNRFGVVEEDRSDPDNDGVSPDNTSRAQSVVHHAEAVEAVVEAEPEIVPNQAPTRRPAAPPAGEPPTFGMEMVALFAAFSLLAVVGVMSISLL